MLLCLRYFLKIFLQSKHSFVYGNFSFKNENHDILTSRIVFKVPAGYLSTLDSMYEIKMYQIGLL